MNNKNKTPMTLEEAEKLLRDLSPEAATVLEKALTLVIAVDISVKNDVKHYNKAGELQATSEEILNTLLNEKEITIKHKT